MTRNDAKFGYFSRPTKAEVVRAAGVEPARGTAFEAASSAVPN